jgi:uncharacterized protein YgiM (DUF1202 family)
MCLSGSAVAQEQKIPDEFLKSLAEDLAALRPEPPPNLASSGDAAMGRLLGVQVSKDVAPVFSGASETAKVLTKASRDSEYPVIDRVGDWYAIQLNAKKSGWIQAADVVPTSQPDQGWWQKQLEQKLRQAAELREKLKDNPYIAMPGFSINAGTSPSITADFEFK